jgi:peptidoglycan/xylan/chitin deacetylase (PgdA/CDA1 family)
MKSLALLVLLVFGLSSFGQKKQVCFSFDDLPVVNYGITDAGYQIKLMDKLILSLKKNKIPAIGFVNEQKLYDGQSKITFQVGLLNSWVDNGLELGNHTYSHSDYNRASFNEYAEDILKDETITKKILSEKGKLLKYFRHPYLHAGNTKAKADSLNDFLSKHGYTVAPVTIDNEDYLFALSYKRAHDKDDQKLMAQIGSDYISYMEKKVKYFEKQAKSLFGRNIRQILLIHASSLNADYVDALANMFRKNNYAFISMDKALGDKAYTSDITKYGDWGISWIDRWALSQGKKGDFFKGDPETPDYIKKSSVE